MTAATLKGKTLFITGASRGIGKAIGVRAARDGRLGGAGTAAVVHGRAAVSADRTGSVARVADRGRALAIQPTGLADVAQTHVVARVGVDPVAVVACFDAGQVRIAADLKPVRSAIAIGVLGDGQGARDRRTSARAPGARRTVRVERVVDAVSVRVVVERGHIGRFVAVGVEGFVGVQDPVPVRVEVEEVGRTCPIGVRWRYPTAGTRTGDRHRQAHVGHTVRVSVDRTALAGVGDPVAVRVVIQMVRNPVAVVVELRRAAPLVELDLLAIPTFTGGNIVFAVFQFEKMIVFIFVALYLQHVLHRSPIEAGIVVSIAILPTLVTSRLAGRIRDAYGTRVPLTITLVVTAACVVTIGLGTRLESLWLIGAVLVVWGAVMPGIAVTARPALMGAVPAEKHGQASGVNLSIQMLGGTIAIAVCSTLLILTGSYWLVFLLTGLVTLGSAAVAWMMVERPGT